MYSRRWLGAIRRWGYSDFQPDMVWVRIYILKNSKIWKTPKGASSRKHFSSCIEEDEDNCSDDELCFLQWYDFLNYESLRVDSIDRALDCFHLWWSQTPGNKNYSPLPILRLIIEGRIVGRVMLDRWDKVIYRLWNDPLKKVASDQLRVMMVAVQLNYIIWTDSGMIEKKIRRKTWTNW